MFEQQEIAELRERVSTLETQVQNLLDKDVKITIGEKDIADAIANGIKHREYPIYHSEGNFGLL